jgi:acyl-CoA synthetase (AMP-forming)/AMP-acid ligase II
MAAERLAAAFGNFAELVRDYARERPAHAALIQDERALDYAALDAAMDRVARALQRDGIGPGDSVAMCAWNSIEYLVVFLGCLRAGVAAALIQPSLTPQAIGRMLLDSGARRTFLDRPAAHALAAANVAPPEPIVFDGSPSLESWLGSANGAPSPVDVQADWPFNIIYSSGTTGDPKGIVQPHSMRWSHVQRGPAYGYDAATITLISTPLYSNTTLVAVFPTLGMGGTLVGMAKFDAGEYLALAERRRATHTMLVPVQYHRLMARADFAGHDLGAFRAKFSTSAPFTASLKSDVLARWPGGLTEFYGMTEGGGTCVLRAHEHREKLHTVGLPAPGHDIRVLDDEDRELPRGQAGEVVGHSPSMMTGYHRRPELTAQAEWRDAQGRRFIRTGDIGRFDDDGFLVLVDRKKDMIISGGFNVYPSDLESIVRGHPGVADVAVIGVPSVQWGETPVAFVVAHDGVDPRELLAWANARLGKVQRLADVRLVASLPRSPIGKVQKRDLREAYTVPGRP